MVKVVTSYVYRMEKLLEEFPIDFPGRMKMIQDNATNEEDKTYMVATSKVLPPHYIWEIIGQTVIYDIIHLMFVAKKTNMVEVHLEIWSTLNT